MNPTPVHIQSTSAPLDQDGLGDFRQRLQMELNLREIAEEVAQSWQVAYSEEPWLRLRGMTYPKFEIGRWEPPKNWQT